MIILLGKTPIFKREYGKSLSWEALSPILSSLTDFLQQSSDDIIEFMNIVNMKVCYATAKYYNTLVIFITDQTDRDDCIKDETIKIRDIFVNKFSEFLLGENYNPEVYNSIRYDTEESFRELRPKIALVGFSGVGKTTITRLIRAEEIPMKHIPTITGDVAAIKVGSLHMYLWDFAGQEQFSFIWSRFIKGSDAIILVMDSTQQNMKESKFFVDLIKKEAPKARVAIIANKQDIPGAITPELIVNELGYRTYPLVAIDPNQRAAMLNIVAEVVEVTTGVTSLIQPMLERESLVETAEAAIMQGNLLKASEIYNDIAILSENLGEDEMAVIFREQSKLLARQVQAAAKQIQERKIAKPIATSASPRVELPPETEVPKKPEALQTSEQVIDTSLNHSNLEGTKSKDDAVPELAPTAVPALNVNEKAKIVSLEQELTEINNIITELKTVAHELNPDEFEKEMIQLENRKDQIHRKIMEIRMNIIKKLAV